ncbi:MAG: FkbM family methyltransferase [Thermoplasmata archaeon]
MKDVIRKICFNLNLPITANLENDILLKKILKKNLNLSDNTIDVGCHKGEILELLLKYAPNGKHFAIEPIPYFYERLKDKFPSVEVLPYALSDENSQSEFFWIKNKPAYSGLNKRTFSEKNNNIEKIKVEVKKLDDIIPENISINFIKIDVEGAEMKVLKGAQTTLKKNKPLIAFEFGIGGSDYYQTNAADIFNFFENLNYKIYDLKGYLNNQPSYKLHDFEQVYKDNIIYNFIAIPY